eukprot:EC124838.1.p1 GENE.EC124838.1~~EC124838.1.p1  ORF type:complete len:194 (+),score=56.23 EC124838.1:71-652(+)
MSIITYDDDKALGKPAPSIASAKFLKGDPTDVTDGKVHVLLFMAQYDKGNYPVIAAFSNLADKYTEAVFTGLSIDPKEEVVVKFLTSKEDPTAIPPDFTFGVAWDQGKEVASTYKEAGQEQAITIPTAYITKAGSIVWKERFGQAAPVSKSQFEEQLKRVLAGEELIKNGPAPKTDAPVIEEEVNVEGDFSLF